MSSRLNAMVITAITAFVLFWLGVSFVFGPALAGDQPAAVLPDWLGLAIASILFVVLLDWVNGSVGNAVKSAMIIAISQIILVDIYYPLIGRRGWVAAAASIAVLLVGWFIVGTVYGRLTAGGNRVGVTRPFRTSIWERWHSPSFQALARSVAGPTKPPICRTPLPWPSVPKKRPPRTSQALVTPPSGAPLPNCTQVPPASSQ